MTRFLCGVTVGALLLTPAIGAQDARLEQRLDPVTRVAVEAVIDSASRAGLPTAPLIGKALEGSSKRADGPRIVGAVQRLAAHLATARAALGSSASGGELEAGASALVAGASSDDLARLKAMRPRASLVVPLGVLADLVARGVPADSARQAVMVLAAERLRDEDFITFRRNVERDIALGAPPGAATSVRVNAGLNDPIRSAAQGDADGPTGGPIPKRKP